MFKYSIFLLKYIFFYNLQKFIIFFKFPKIIYHLVLIFFYLNSFQKSKTTFWTKRYFFLKSCTIHHFFTFLRTFHCFVLLFTYSLHVIKIGTLQQTTLFSKIINALSFFPYFIEIVIVISKYFYFKQLFYTCYHSYTFKRNTLFNFKNTFFHDFFTFI